MPPTNRIARTAALLLLEGTLTVEALSQELHLFHEGETLRGIMLGGYAYDA